MNLNMKMNRVQHAFLRVDESIQDYIRQAAVKAFKAVDGTGLARCDFFYDNDTGNVYLNEINTMPGFTNSLCILN